MGTGTGQKTRWPHHYNCLFYLYEAAQPNNKVVANYQSYVEVNMKAFLKNKSA
jgi:hypothetical protein